MAHTHKLEVVAQRIKDLITANKVPLTIDAIWYGDQSQVPNGRTVCIEPVTVNRVMSGAPDMVQNNFVVVVIVYLEKVGELQALRTECNVLAEAIEDLLHSHLDLDDNAHTANSDIVVHGFVSENLSGYAYKQNRLVRSSRLTWTGISKTSLRFGP